MPVLFAVGPAVAERLALPKALQKEGPPRKPGGPSKLTLVIDPGHGGRDPGALGRGGLREKDVVLDIARHIADRVPGLANLDVRMTRREDVFIPLHERVQIARKLGADLFVSIHADSAPNRLARGVSAYTLSQDASDALAKALMDSENAVDLLHGVTVANNDQAVADILLDLKRRHSLNSALALKNAVVDGLQGRLPLLDNPKRSANFAVLRAPDIPSILIETGFLSNSEDEKILASAKRRAEIGAVLADVLARSAVRTLAA